MKTRIAAALLLGLVLTGSAGALVTTEQADRGDSLPSLSLKPAARPASAVSSPTVRPETAKPQPVRRGNPLWGIPLRQFTASAARPLFAPSRRPPPVPVAAVSAPTPPPPPKPEPEKPSLALLGTVAFSPSGGIGLFIDQGTKALVRLKMGEDHHGWILRQVQRREVVLERAREKLVLTLPAANASAGAGSIAVAAQTSPTPAASPPATAPAWPGTGTQAAALTGADRSAAPPPAPGATPFSGMLQMLRDGRTP